MKHSYDYRCPNCGEINIFTAKELLTREKRGLAGEVTPERCFGTTDNGCGRRFYITFDLEPVIKTRPVGDDKWRGAA